MPRVAVLCIICIILYYVLSGIMYFDTLRAAPTPAHGAWSDTGGRQGVGPIPHPHQGMPLYPPLAKSRAHVAPGRDT